LASDSNSTQIVAARRPAGEPTRPLFDMTDNRKMIFSRRYRDNSGGCGAPQAVR
jgi:hypothetical protein